VTLEVVGVGMAVLVAAIGLFYVGAFVRFEVSHRAQERRATTKERTDKPS
jgi:hypothetical protein